MSKVLPGGCSTRTLAHRGKKKKKSKTTNKILKEIQTRKNRDSLLLAFFLTSEGAGAQAFLGLRWLDWRDWTGRMCCLHWWVILWPSVLNPLSRERSFVYSQLMLEGTIYLCWWIRDFCGDIKILEQTPFTVSKVWALWGRGVQPSRLSIQKKRACTWPNTLSEL